MRRRDVAAMKARDHVEAWDKQEKFEGQSSGWIQWKGTNVCLDIHCSCGKSSHVDGEFAYSVECPHCHTIYFCNGHIQLIEIEDPTGCGPHLIGDK